MERPWEKFYDEHLTADFEYPHVTVADLLSQASEKYPDKNALHFFDYHLTYSELQRKVEQMAHGLKSLGVKKGDRVGIMLPNCPQYLISYFGVLSIGAVVVQISPFYTHDEMEKIIKDASAKTIV